MYIYNLLIFSTYFYSFPSIDLPDSVKNCSLKTLKSKDIKITCIPGLSGGLEQRFVLKVSISYTMCALYLQLPSAIVLP